MQPTRRFVALALTSVVVLGACTGGDDGPDGTGGTGVTGPIDTGPTPAQTFTPGSGEFTYENAGLVVTLDVQGRAGTLEVDNGTEFDLEAPSLYVLDAVDGHEVDLEVEQAAPVGAGDTATFQVSLGEVDVDQVGLLILLFGPDNYGAFVRTA